LSSAAIAAIATPLFAALARRFGLVVAPRPDRWHATSTPLLGGAAIALAALVPLALVVQLDLRGAGLLVACAAAFGLGLLDDFRRIAPTSKLVGQVIVAGIVVGSGTRVELVSFPPLSFLLTVFWIVAIMNAVNLIDNMDGLAAGISAIAAISLAFGATPMQGPAVTLAAATAGAAIGFLVHNFSPARVFMGDAGSQVLGLLLATAALLYSAESAANVGLALVGPLAMLALPIFDTTLVFVSRVLHRLPVSQGGRDHTSHRLASLGLSDRETVVLLYIVATSLAALGVVVSAVASAVLPLLALGVLGLVLFGVFLFGVDSYRARVPEDDRPVARTLPVYVRFGAEVGLDVALLTVAYYTSYLVRFEGFPETAWIGLFVQSLPIVIGIQLATLVLTRVYRTLWRYLGVGDAMLMIRAVSTGTAVAALAILLGFRFEGYSRAVFVFDWLFAAVLLIGARSFTLWLRHIFAIRPRSGERRVLIVGAADNGSVALRLLTSASEVPYRPVGFADDDPGKRYRRIGGVPIVGTTDQLADLVKKFEVELVVLAPEDRREDEIHRLRGVCEELGVECREFVALV
jgi:UDP-GlcNAc:undecaprenyl-phosphate GlcNAc-1-phosphate transferase